MPNDAWIRLGRLLAEQRGRIEPNARKFADDTGLNYRLIYDLENAKRSNFSRPKLAQAEEAYRWAPGSINRVLEGGDPTPLRVDLGTVPTTPGTPPIEDGEPSIYFSGPPTLKASEQLWGWNIGQGQTHYRYSVVTPEGRIDLRAPMSADVPLDDVVKRMRMMADLARM